MRRLLLSKRCPLPRERPRSLYFLKSSRREKKVWQSWEAPPDSSVDSLSSFISTGCDGLVPVVEDVMRRGSSRAAGQQGSEMRDLPVSSVSWQFGLFFLALSLIFKWNWQNEIDQNQIKCPTRAQTKRIHAETWQSRGEEITFFVLISSSISNVWTNSGYNCVSWPGSNKHHLSQCCLICLIYSDTHRYLIHQNQ